MANKIFISYASEDKDEIARPLSLELTKHGFDIWFDESSLALGDNLRRSIDEGLATCDFGVVVLSEKYFSKEWPKIELEGLIAKEILGGKVILPVWHKITREKIFEHSPILSNKLAVSSEKGVDFVTNQIVNAVTKNNELAAIQKNIDYHRRAFKIITFDIPGEKIKNNILTNWISRNNLDSKLIEKVELYSYEDYSGLEISYPSGIYLKDGIVIKITDLDVINVINDINSKIFPDYDVILFKPEPNKFGEKEAYISIEHCFISVVAIKSDIVISNPNDSFLLMLELAEYLDEVGRGMYSSFSFDSLFDKGLYAYKLFKIILNEQKYDIIERLIFENLSKDRFSWTISQLFISHLQNNLSNEELRLLKKLIESPEPLNDYWKKRLKKQYKLTSKTT